MILRVIQALPYAQGTPTRRGILSARRAVVTHELVPGFPDSTWTTFTWVTELITMTLQALLDNGDQVLIPSPDYPLWTASTSLWLALRSTTCAMRPKLAARYVADLESKITESAGAGRDQLEQATGAVYSVRNPPPRWSIWPASINCCCGGRNHDKSYDDAKHQPGIDPWICCA